MTNFFISYNRADRAWAEWIAWQLEEAKYTTTLQAWDFLPGTDFVQKMDDATKEAERTIAVLSKAYLAAMFTKPEWHAAFRRDPTGEQGILIPVRIQQCDVEGLLGQIVRIDLVSLDEAAANKALLAGVRRERAKPDSAPMFPPEAERSVKKQPRFPGALPEIWNIPYLQNPNFTGREEILSDLRAALSSGKTAALTQAIHGLGGVGKTQLAVEYAYRHGASYDLVWWVRSEQPTTLRAEYAGLATRLDLPEKEAQDQQLIVEAVKAWLRQNRNWLLILDNAPDARSVREYIPTASTGHIIVTSRDANWRGVAEPLTVRVLPESEAVEFILKRTGQQDKETAVTLANTLGCLPLALEQAGAYIETRGRTLSYYLNLFQERKKEILQRGKPSTDYPDTIATTWEMSFQQVETENPAAADLLKLCAFFAPDDIPLYIIKEGAEHLPEPLASVAADPLAFDDTLAELRRYSLIEVEAEFISVHRLVQAVTQHRMEQEAVKQWTEAAVRILNDAFPNDSEDFRTWEICSLLLSHALATLSDAERLKLNADVTTNLLNKVGTYLYGRADFKQAESLFKRALSFGESAFGPDHTKVATYANNVGMVLQDLGDLAGAKIYYERALAIDEAALGPDHPDVAIDLNNLGTILQELGDLDGAKGNYERALAIDGAALGSDHPNVARDVNNLGMVLQELGDLDGAKANFERALDIGEAAFGNTHPQVAIFANNLGLVLQELGDLDGAKANFERAVAIDEAALGANHPNVARYVNNLGMVLKELGDLAGARAHVERALRIFRESLGEDHPTTITVRNNLKLLGRP